MNRIPILLGLGLLFGIQAAQAQVNPFGPPAGQKTPQTAIRAPGFRNDIPGRSPAFNADHSAPSLALKMHFIGRINGMYIYKNGDNFVYRKKPLYKINPTAPSALSGEMLSSRSGSVPRLPPPIPARNVR